MTNPSGGDAPSVPLHEAYAEEIRVHAVLLIWLGFKRLNTRSFATAEEDDITGEIIREMKLVTQDPSSPDWVEHYEIHEQSRQNVVGKFGKNRPIMDIQIVRHKRGPRPCLGFEAKRLGPGNAIGGYLDKEGLDAFLSGYYPTTHGEAGMLGYVQAGTTESWSQKLAKAFSKNPEKHRVNKDCKLVPVNAKSAGPYFSSSHTDGKNKPLLVVHVLLPFMN
jgi:hypothetical protein